MLPNVDIDSVSSDSVSVNHVPPGSEPALPPVNAVIQVLIGLNVCEFKFVKKEKMLSHYLVLVREIRQFPEKWSNYSEEFIM